MYNSIPVSMVLQSYFSIKTIGDAFLGGGTALYDSTSTALNVMKATQALNKDAKGNISATDASGSTILRTIVVFTDGEDLHSRKTTLPTLVQEFAKPGFGNFHYVCLVAGADQAAAQQKLAFENVCHAKIIPVSDCSSESIKKVFGEADKQMQKVKSKLVEELKLVIINKSKNAKPVMAEALGHVSQQMNSGHRGAQRLK